MDKKIIFYDLRMLVKAENEAYTLNISVESGFAEYNVIIDINAQDFKVIEKDINIEWHCFKLRYIDPFNFKKLH